MDDHFKHEASKICNGHCASPLSWHTENPQAIMSGSQHRTSEQCRTPPPPPLPHTYTHTHTHTHTYIHTSCTCGFAGLPTATLTVLSHVILGKSKMVRSPMARRAESSPPKMKSLLPTRLDCAGGITRQSVQGHSAECESGQLMEGEMCGLDCTWLGGNTTRGVYVNGCCAPDGSYSYQRMLCIYTCEHQRQMCALWPSFE